MSIRGIAVAGGIFTLFLAGCGTDETAQNTTVRTEREKDSIIARSPIPGAKAVQKTLNVTDSVAARQSRIDSSQQNP
ncbi:MAG TPA: hypothetical protein VF887_10130 [Gemmatimonadaceae bacterium]